jgi:cell division protein FtsQ
MLAGALFVYARADQLLASSPRFQLQPLSAEGESGSLRIEGAVHTPKTKIMDVFAADFGRSLYLMPLAERRKALMAIDWVKEATVSRLWPDRIRVRIVERTPVAFIQMPDAARQGLNCVALIDAEGIILESPARANLKLPVLAGVTSGQTQAMRQRRVAAALRLFSELGGLSEGLAEIDVGDTSNVKVVRQINGRAIFLQLGNRNFLPRLQNFQNRFEEIEKRLPNAAAFDLRLDDRITALSGDGRGE